MDKNTISFVIICVVVVFSVLGVYTYNHRLYESQSTMAIVTFQDVSTTNVINVVSSMDTTVSLELPVVTTTIVMDTTTILTTTLPIDTTEVTFKTTTVTTMESKRVETEKVVEFPISLNSITFDELICIKGIGEVTAQKILDYRNSIGGYFTSRYQLLDISGIGDSKMNTIMEYTYIENENLNYYQEVVTQAPQIDYESPQNEPIQEDYPIGIEYSQEVPQSEVQFPINLNTATLEELCSIPNVDENIAQEILSLRDTIQYFSHLYELLYIESVSEQFLSEIMDYICVE